MSRLGFNVDSSQSNVLLAPCYARTNGGEVIQIFTRSPQVFNTKSLFLDKIFSDEFKYQMQQFDIPVVIHSSFLINLCRPPSDPKIWGALNLVISDLKIASDINAIGAIIHMGKNTKDMNITVEAAKENYVKNINHIMSKTPETSILILETGAGCGNEISTQLNELGQIRNNVKPEYKDRIKFCIDTCHIFSAGYDLTNFSFVDSLINYVDSSLGWENVVIIHLNDSKTKLNSKTDRHEEIGFGYITEKNPLPFIKFLKYINSKKIPMVLETNIIKSTFAQQLNYVKNLMSLV